MGRDIYNSVSTAAQVLCRVGKGDVLSEPLYNTSRSASGAQGYGYERRQDAADQDRIEARSRRNITAEACYLDEELAIAGSPGRRQALLPLLYHYPQHRTHGVLRL